MSKASKKPEAAPSMPVTGRFYAVAKVEHLLYEAVEIELKDGVVTAVRILSRAPDLAATAVGACTRELWVNLRALTKADVEGTK